MRTDIAGFVGVAERGPLPEDFAPEKFDGTQAIVKVNSWREFVTTFGSFREYGYLAYAVRAFFENGGDQCYCARIAATTAADPAQRPAKALFSLPSGAAIPVGTIHQLVNPFQFSLTALAAGNYSAKADDLLLISGGGVTQFTHVACVLASRQILLTNQVDPQIASGASVSYFPSACVISAASRGNWGNIIRIEIVPYDATTFGLRATVDLGPNTPPSEEEYYRTLSLVPGSYNYAPNVLATQSNLIRMEVGSGPIALPQPPSSLSTGVVYLQGGRDGLAAISLRDFSGGPTDLRGLRLLEQIDEIAMIAVPDAMFEAPDVLQAPAPQPDPCVQATNATPNPVADDPTAVLTALTPGQTIQLQLAMIDQCQRLRYRVAILDTPDKLQISQAQNWPSSQGLVFSPPSRFAAIYYPWMMAPDALELAGRTRSVPPSGYVAGAYAFNDLAYGVQRPPGNIELQFVVDVQRDISDLQQAGLNLNDVNAIRAFPGRGIRVWGARSLAEQGDDDWRFIHVRRLMSAIEATVERSTGWVVFQSNTDALRKSLTHSLNVLLRGIWARGGLKGNQPQEAYYVKCDAKNNPQTVVDQGQLICEIGVAIAVPMEFLVFEIRQDASGAQILEN
ncbi:MAG TPA: phage tail sheath C-terminal domain-containing protein [Candidatus Solibacter sp.]|nr:phage tail sheath C-terminal domain-containing protein [Candidatus Solibacter sp.]